MLAQSRFLEFLIVQSISYSKLYFLGLDYNRAVVAINEDELKRNKGKQGNETVILSTYGDEESVCKDREDSEDPDESTADVLIFADTLLNALKRTTRKGKTKWKWTGKIAELKNFVALVLEHNGSRKIRRENNKQMHVFEESDYNYVLTWWPSTQGMLFQGNPDVCSTINALDIVEETKPKPGKTTTANSGKKSGMKKNLKNVNLALTLSLTLSRKKTKKRNKSGMP